MYGAELTCYFGALPEQHHPASSELNIVFVPAALVVWAHLRTNASLVFVAQSWLVRLSSAPTAPYCLWMPVEFPRLVHCIDSHVDLPPVSVLGLVLPRLYMVQIVVV